MPFQPSIGESAAGYIGIHRESSLSPRFNAMLSFFIEELKDHVPYVVSRGLAPIHQLIPLLEKIGCKKSYHFKSQNWQTEFQQITPPWSFGTVGKYILPQDKKKEGAKLVIIFLNREHT